MKRGNEGGTTSARGKLVKGYRGYGPVNASLVALALAASGCGGSSSTSTTTPSSTSTTTPAKTTTIGSTTTTSATSTSKQADGGAHQAQPTTPEATVEAALTAQDPKLACGLYSEALLESAYGDLNGCVAAIQSGGTAKSVKIVSSDTSGTTATVVAIPSGGPSSGEKLTYTLVSENGEWRLDQVKSNVKVGP
jgi:hypothetical protein